MNIVYKSQIIDLFDKYETRKAWKTFRSKCLKFRIIFISMKREMQQQIELSPKNTHVKCRLTQDGK